MCLFRNDLFIKKGRYFRPYFNEEFFQTLLLVDIWMIETEREAVSSFYMYLTSTPLMSLFPFRRDVVKSPV